MAIKESDILRYGSLIRLMGFLLIVLGILSVSAWFLNTSFRTVVAQEAWVTHTNSVISELDLVLSATKDAESGVRGFAITNDESHLAVHRQGIVDAEAHLARVSELTGDNSHQKVAIAELRVLLQRRFKILEDYVDLTMKAGSRPSSLSSAFVAGPVVMNAIRALVEKMKNAERELLSNRAEEFENSKSAFVISLLLSTLVSASAISIAFYQIGSHQLKKQKEAEEKHREAIENEYIAQLAKDVSGDITFEDAASAVLRFVSNNLGFLAAKLSSLEQGRPRLIAAVGVDENNGGSSASSLLEAAVQKASVWPISMVPESYWRISSGLGSAVPKNIIFVPIRFQGRMIGIMELASFTEVNNEKQKLLERFAETVGIGLNAAKSRNELQALLERTQLQSEELQAQQEELRTNNEELEQQARALETQQQALNVQNKELETTQRELQKRAADLQRSSQYKSEFLAKMSHELRTPLNGLLILSTLLIENKEKNLTEQQRQFARSINNAGNDLLTLINDILDLSKIEARKLTLRAEEFEVKDVVQSTRAIFEPQTSAKGLELLAEIPQELRSLKLKTDRQRLEQILRNFLSNAVKFTEKGSITVSAKFDEKRRMISFSVRDTGVGVPKEKHAGIFEAFEQADSSISRKYGGTGLGLTISRELAILLGGAISLESQEGLGSSFTVAIPIELPAAHVGARPLAGVIEPAPPSSLASAALKAHTHFDDEMAPMPKSEERLRTEVKAALQAITPGKKSILVVEDDEAFRISIVEAIHSYGFDPVQTSNGETALAILKEHIPSAILLDIKLPGISGLGILEMIKQMPHLRHIPVHMISALDYQHNALRMGALGYLTKPVTIDKVRAALSRIEKIISTKVRRVLLIEDDSRQNMAVSQLIAGDDIRVESAETGKAAVEMLEKEGYDCIILDLTLPDVSGFDLLEELSKLEISLPPIVIYTGKDLSDAEERYLRKFSESIIIKGARSPERLLDEVNLFLHRVESMLPASTREMLSNLRSQERSFEGKKVLVVDDDIRNVFALTSALESKDFRVQVARDGIEALEAIDSSSDIDIVLMDIMMPRMDGFEAIRRIRQNKDSRIRNLPVIALTAKAMKEDHEKCMDAGASDYLPKPVNLENLNTILKVWLAPRGILA